MEQECLQPITIATVLISAAMIPVHLYCMISLFSKMNSNFQKEALQIRNFRRVRLESAIDVGYEGEFFI